MIKKTIIVVSGTANVGKSMTLSSLGRNLISNGGLTTTDVNAREYRAVIDYQNNTLGLQTYGDTEQLVTDGLNIFSSSNCDIIIIASKKYGKTINAINSFAQNHSYRVITTTPLENRDGLIQVSTLKDYGASIIKRMIDEIIQGNL